MRISTDTEIWDSHSNQLCPRIMGAVLSHDLLAPGLSNAVLEQNSTDRTSTTPDT